jgi:hypothetical protein
LKDYYTEQMRSEFTGSRKLLAWQFSSDSAEAGAQAQSLVMTYLDDGLARRDGFMHEPPQV